MLSKVLWFRTLFGDSRLYEFQCVAEQMLGFSPSWNWNTDIQILDGGDIGPNLIQNLPDEIHEQLERLTRAATQTMSCSGVFSIIAHGITLEKCIEDVQNKFSKDVADLFHGTWCFRFSQLGKGNRFSPTMRRDIVERFGTKIPSLHILPVDIEHPDHEIYYLEDHRRPKGVPAMKRDQQPHQVWLLFKHKSIESTKNIRAWEKRLALTKRAFLSATTMEPKRALQLANMALHGNGSGKTLLDPFCGSGSLLLAATALGASCVGSDKLRYLLLRHKRVTPIPPSAGRPLRGVEKVSFYDNFTEQNLPEPIILENLDIFSEDVSTKLLSANDNTSFDSILTDPPYGIRASLNHEKHQIINRLLMLASTLLKDMGTLIFLFPEQGTETDIHTFQQEHFIYNLAVQHGFTVRNLGWERFQKNTLRMIAVLQRDKSIIPKSIIPNT
jgi:tRNA G10  N-methylase Trm11